MTTETLVELEDRRTGGDFDINHTTECHDENRSLCGLDITDEPWVMDPPPEDECAVCLDLAPLHCGCPCGCCDGDPE